MGPMTGFGERLRMAGLLLAGCCGCFYPADRGRALEARVDRLSGQSDTLDQQMKAAQAALAEKTTQVTEALESLDKASRRTDADTGVQLQKTMEDVSALRGQVESYLHKLTELEASLQKVNEESERKFTELKGSDAVKAAEARRKVEELPRPTDKREFLSLADSKAKAGETLVGRQLYNEFLKKWPRDALAANAHFALGESFSGEDKCREALFEYGKVIQDFPKAPSAADAYLESSECFDKLKMTEESKLALEEIVKTYPRSDAARTAKTRLAELDRPAKKGAQKKAKR